MNNTTWYSHTELVQNHTGLVYTQNSIIPERAKLKFIYKRSKHDSRITGNESITVEQMYQ